MGHLVSETTRGDVGVTGSSRTNDRDSRDPESDLSPEQSSVSESLDRFPAKTDSDSESDEVTAPPSGGKSDQDISDLSRIADGDILVFDIGSPPDVGSIETAPTGIDTPSHVPDAGSLGAPPAQLNIPEPSVTNPEISLKIKASGIRSITELLRFAYQQDGKRFTVSTAVFMAIDTNVRSESGLTDRERNAKRTSEVSLAGELAGNDPLLAVPPKLLGEIMDQPEGAATKKRLGEIMSMVFRGTAAFDADVIRSALISTPADRDAVFVALNSRIARLSDHLVAPTASSLRLKEREKLASNAVVSLALILDNRDRWTMEALIECLSFHLWGSPTQVVQRPRSVLTDSKSPEAIRLVVDAYAGKVARAESLFREALVDVENERSRAQIAEALIEERDESLAERSKVVESLELGNTELVKKIADGERQLKIERSRHISDYEALRTRIIRMLELRSELLVDGLHALQNGSPNVTEGYIERTLNAFRSELTKLMEGSGSN